MGAQVNTNATGEACARPSGPRLESTKRDWQGENCVIPFQQAGTKEDGFHQESACQGRSTSSHACQHKVLRGPATCLPNAACIAASSPASYPEEPLSGRLAPQSEKAWADAIISTNGAGHMCMACSPASSQINMCTPWAGPLALPGLCQQVSCPPSAGESSPPFTL